MFDPIAAGHRASSLDPRRLDAATGGRAATWAVALAVFAAVYGYCAVFRSYGFQIEDEGTLLFQLDRVARGQFPYVDFGTGYTPGFFWAGAWLLRHCDFRVESLRAVLALLHAATAAGLYVVAARVVGRALALVAPLAWIAFLPVRPGDFAAFNVPYPAWPVTLAWVLAAVAITGFALRGGLARLAVVGLAAAAAFAVKPNAGALMLAATTWTVALFARDGARERASDATVAGSRDGGHAAARARRIDCLATWLGAAAMALGVWFVLGLEVVGIDVAVHLVPCLGLALVCAGLRRGALGAAAHPRALPALTVTAVAFALPTLLWAVPVLGRLGVAGFARDVLLIGSGAADLYYVAHPRPELYALAVTAGVLAIAAAGRAVAAGRLPAGPAAAALALAGATVLAAATTSVAPEGFRRGVCWQLENAAFWLAPLASYGALLLLTTRLARPSASPRDRMLAALTALATAMYVQLYPRCDFMHLMMSVPLLLVVALALLDRVASWWRRGSWQAVAPQHATAALIVVAVTFVLSVRFGLDLEPIARTAGGQDVRRSVIATARAHLWVEASAADDLVAFGKTVDYLAARTTPGEDVLTFPALAGALFAAGRASPVPHDYWYPGRPSHEEEATMVASLEAAPPRYIVTLNQGWSFFIGSPAYFTTAESFARSRYRLEARLGRFDVLGRRDLVASTAVVDRWQPQGPASAIAQPETAARRQAVRRWMAALTPQQAARASLPAKRRDAILFLRGLRDTGDLRTTAWLMAGYDSGDARLRSEAEGAMELVGAGFEPLRHRWAGDFDVAALRPYVEPYRDRALQLLAGGAPRLRAFASAVVSITRNDSEAAGEALGCGVDGGAEK